MDSSRRAWRARFKILTKEIPWGGDDSKDPAAFAANVKTLQEAIANSSPGARVILYMDPTRRFDSVRQEKGVRADGKVHREYFDDGPVQTLSDEDVRLIQAKAWQAWQEWKAFCRAPAK